MPMGPAGLRGAAMDVVKHGNIAARGGSSPRIAKEALQKLWAEGRIPKNQETQFYMSDLAQAEHPDALGFIFEKMKKYVPELDSF